MIKVFGESDRDFTSNGDVVLKPYKAKIHKEDNGAFYLDLETGLEYAECLTEGRIVAVDTPSGEQLFRLHNVTMTRKKITTRAYHIFYDAEDYIIPSTFINNKICSEALNQLNAATDVPSPFTFSSDVETITSFECVRQTLKNAVFTVLERWGGHLSFDGFNVAIKRQIGRDNGVTVRYAKNLRDIQVSYDWDGVVTKLLPVGKDGILLNAIDPNASLYVYADVEPYPPYPLHYCKTVNFNQSLRQEDFDTEDEYKQALVNDLRSQAQIYVDGNCYPKVNYTLKANLDRISDVGDVIQVIDYRLGLSLDTNLIAYDWDCLLKRFTECEFGNFRRKLSDLFSTIDRNTANTVFRASSDLSDRINATDQTVENLSGEVGDVASATETLTDTLTAKVGTTKSYSGVCGGMMSASEIRFSIPVQDMTDKTVTLTELMVTVVKSGGTVVLDEQYVTSDSAVLNHGNTLLIIISGTFSADVVSVDYSIEVSIS